MSQIFIPTITSTVSVASRHSEIQQLVVERMERVVQVVLLEEALEVKAIGIRIKATKAEEKEALQAQSSPSREALISLLAVMGVQDGMQTSRKQWKVVLRCSAVARAARPPLSVVAVPLRPSPCTAW